MQPFCFMVKRMSNQVEKLKAILDENAISEEDFANCIGIDVEQSMAYCLGKKKLSKVLARQIEQTFSKPALWIDIDSDDSVPNYDLFG